MAVGERKGTLYLHIGMHKTGTTAIQNFCETHRKELARRGYYYPIFPYSSGATTGNAEFLMESRRGSDGGFFEPDERIWKACLDGVERKLRRYPNVILSNEDIWNQPGFRNRCMWTRLKQEANERGFDVRILLYLRRQDQLLYSFWAQEVKSARLACGQLSFAQMLSQAEDWLVLDYHRQLEEIATIFGRSAIAVRVYDRRRFPEGNVVPDFFQTIGLSTDMNFTFSAYEANPSIRGDALEFKRIVNTLPNLSRLTLRTLKQAALDYSAQEQNLPERSLFSQAELSTFLARYTESNRRLAQDYLGDADAPLFDPPKELPPVVAPVENQRLESLVRFFALAMQYQEQTGDPLTWLRRRLSLRTRLRRLRCVIQRRLGWVG